jgi:hypothetical protein
LTLPMTNFVKHGQTNYKFRRPEVNAVVVIIPKDLWPLQLLANVLAAHRVLDVDKLDFQNRRSLRRTIFAVFRANGFKTERQANGEIGVVLKQDPIPGAD